MKKCCESPGSGGRTWKRDVRMASIVEATSWVLKPWRRVARVWASQVQLLVAGSHKSNIVQVRSPRGPQRHFLWPRIRQAMQACEDRTYPGAFRRTITHVLADATVVAMPSALSSAEAVAGLPRDADLYVHRLTASRLAAGRARWCQLLHVKTRFLRVSRSGHCMSAHVTPGRNPRSVPSSSL